MMACVAHAPGVAHSLPLSEVEELALSEVEGVPSRVQLAAIWNSAPQGRTLVAQGDSPG